MSNSREFSCTPSDTQSSKFSMWCNPCKESFSFKRSQSKIFKMFKLVSVLSQPAMLSAKSELKALFFSRKHQIEITSFEKRVAFVGARKKIDKTLRRNDINTTNES